MSRELSTKDWLLSRRRDPRLERITGNLIVLVAALLACWTIWLGSSLPPDPLIQHWSLTADIGLDNYSLTWVGLDCIEVLGLTACGLLFRRASPSARTVALLTIPVFCLDAWFDIMTSVSKADLVTAVVMALLGELPAAFILSWIAWKALPFHQAAVTADPAGHPGPPPASSHELGIGAERGINRCSRYDGAPVPGRPSSNAEPVAGAPAVPRSDPP